MFGFGFGKAAVGLHPISPHIGGCIPLPVSDVRQRSTCMQELSLAQSWRALYTVKVYGIVFIMLHC